MSNIDKRAYSVSQIIADLKLKHGSGDTYAPIMRWNELLALLDELEAKDKSISFLKDQLAQLANFNPDWDKLEAATYSLREHMAELTAARKRIAELEAKLDTADELQDSAFRHGLQHGFSLGQTDNQAGFEECLSAYGTGKGE
ncbi:ead/Ea22-like family protein [Enterobacter cloacae complex sp.6701062]|uniref:ead/Ea22-like family protein n=1 Tax=unclassified Enterobacter cloacae complex TaxID=2757714 RepID=UPI003AAA55E3